MKLRTEVFALSQIIYQKKEEEKPHKLKKRQVLFLKGHNTRDYLKLQPAAAPLYS